MSTFSRLLVERCVGNVVLVPQSELAALYADPIWQRLRRYPTNLEKAASEGPTLLGYAAGKVWTVLPDV
jgi:hypothetical protein